MPGRFVLNVLGLWLAVTVAVGAAPRDFDVRGVVVHHCSCPYACPCMFENGPSSCALAAVYHLDQGEVDGVGVSGLSMISIDGAVPSSERAAAGAPAGVVYLDERASPPQQRALLALLEAHGEWPGPGRPVRRVPIRFTVVPAGYRTLVPDVFRGEAEAAKSRKGTALVVDGVGFVEGARWTVGRSTVNDLHDAGLGLHWHLPGTNGSWCVFHWTKREEKAPVGH